MLTILIENAKKSINSFRIIMKLTNSAKIGIGWAIVVTGGIYAFYLSKSSIERQRYEHMKVRERIKHANQGEYDPSTRKYAN